MSRGFRVWDKQTKSYEWDREFVLGSSGELMELYSNHNGTWEYHFADTNRFIIEFDTGLKDKKGKKIYEGDIIGFTTVKPEYEKDVRRGTIVFYKDSFCVYDGVYIALGRVNNSQWHKCVVVGNIHEPPKDFRPEHLKRMGVSIRKGGEE